MKSKPELTPVQAKEEMDHLLALQIEHMDLSKKCSKAQEAYKAAKEKLDFKTDEIMKHLAELNEELPLWDKPEDVPWPFPVPEECEAARLSDIAAEPNVLGLTTWIVKHVAEELKAKTLGQLQKELKAGTKMKPTEADKAKHALAERIGVNATVKLLRAVTSFTGQRKAKLPPARGKKTEAPPAPEHPYNWRLLPIKEVVSQKAAEALEKVDVKTVSDFQTFLDKLMEKQPKDNTEKHYVRDRLVEQLLLPTEAAQKLMDNVSDYMKANIKPKGK